MDSEINRRRFLGGLVKIVATGLTFGGIVGCYKKEDSAETIIEKEESYVVSDFSNDSDKVLMARMLYGEARSCSRNERIAVGYSVINRVNDGKRWNGGDVRSVILKPKQYSCFNQGDPNLEKIKNPDMRFFYDCLISAGAVLDGRYSQLNKGQTHYFNPKHANPSWKAEMKRIGKIGGSVHVFYRED